jgi:acyl carrier protein
MVDPGSKTMIDVPAVKQLDSPEVLAWLTLKFADWLEVAPDELDSSRPISSYGLDSISAVTLSVQLEEELGVELDTALLWDRPTIESLAEHLTEKLNSADMTRLPGTT